jgi:hypothetical protein
MKTSIGVLVLSSCTIGSPAGDNRTDTIGDNNDDGGDPAVALILIDGARVGTCSADPTTACNSHCCGW